MESTSNQLGLPQWPRRKPDAHKGDFGLALIVGGSRGMAGAAALAGMAALRGGAGLVRLAVPTSCLDVVAAHEPSYMTVALPEDEAGRIAAESRPLLVEAAQAAGVVACGPGMGRSDELTDLVGWLYRNLRGPMVVDADGLNALAARDSVLNQPGGPRILTPHPGEFARLLGVDRVAADQRTAAAVDAARRWNVTLVLKGHQTCITDGHAAFHNTTGNPGMATGGTGDVLTGIITALVSQHLSPFDAARLGVHVHGLAGDLSAAELGQVSMIASDLIRYLPAAWQRVESEGVGNSNQ